MAIDHLTEITPIRRPAAIEVARTAYGRFADVVEQLEDADWGRPTDCEGWTVRDLVGHVVGAMRAAASIRENLSQLREIRGRVRRDGGTITDTMTQVQIDRTAALDRAALVRECRSLVDAAAKGRARTPAPARRLVRFRVEMPGIDETWRLGYLVDVILTRDAWLHRIDLCRAVDRAPVLTADHDGRIVADVAAEWARRHGRPCRLELHGPAGGSYRFGSDDDTVVDLDAVEFCRILSGRAPGEGLLATPVPF
jgi:uncharacterized protein (TIGR03083 family)